jgi:hypothetical protein
MVGENNHPCRGALELQPLKSFQILAGREGLTQQDENGPAPGHGRNVRCRLDDILRKSERRVGQDVLETGVKNGVAADQQGGDARNSAGGDGLRLLPDDDTVLPNRTSPLMPLATA